MWIIFLQQKDPKCVIPYLHIINFTTSHLHKSDTMGLNKNADLKHLPVDF